MLRNKSSVESFLSAIGQLYTLNIPIDFKALIPTSSSLAACLLTLGIMNTAIGMSLASVKNGVTGSILTTTFWASDFQKAPTLSLPGGICCTSIVSAENDERGELVRITGT